MRRFDMRTIIGAGLILLGGLLFLEKIGILHDASGLFLGLAFVAAGAYFLYVYWTDRRARFWAIIPAMLCIAIGGQAFLPPALKDWNGAFFLGVFGLAFWIIYATDRAHWWGIIPGGVLFTLAAVSALDDHGISGEAAGSFFFLGLAVTFALVALLPNTVGSTRWAFIPAGILAALGLLVGTALVGLAGYVWPVALVLVGLLMIFGFFFRRA